MVNQIIDAHNKKNQIKNEPTGKKHKKGIIIVLGFGAIKRI